MTAPPTVDVHAHMFPRGAAVAASQGRAWHGMSFALGPDGGLTLESRVGARYTWNPKYWEGPEPRRETMRRQSIDVEVLSVSGSMLGYQLDAPNALAAAREINDEIAEMCAAASGVFLGLGTLPLQDTDLALGELQRVVADLRLFGIVAGANVNGELWDSPRLFPILQTAVQAGLFVLFHPDPWMYDRSLSQYHVTEVLAHQSQVTYTAASLIFGGVLDRLPEAPFCVGQSGGFSAFAAGRFDHAYRLWREQQVVQGLPSTYLARLYYDSLTYGLPALRSLMEMAGTDRVLLGTDHPSSVTTDDPVGWLERSDLASGQRTAILRGNFEQLNARQATSQQPARR